MGGGGTVGFSSGEIFGGAGGEDLLFDEEVVGVGDGHFKVRVADIEIEEGVFGVGELDELGVVSAPFHAAAEGGDMRTGGDAVGGAMEQEHGGELAADEGGGAECLGGGFVGKAIGKGAFRGGIDQGAEEDEGGGGRRGGFCFLLHGEHECEVGAPGGAADCDFCGIDTEDGGVMVKPFEGGSRVFKGFQGSGGVLG